MRSRNATRGSAIVAIVALVAVLAVLSPASAAPSFIVAVPGSAASTYGTPFVVLQHGNALTFVNLDVASHDVRSGTPAAPTGKFQSALIGVGKKTPVVGAQSLKKGSYKFFCSIHHNMTGTLRVV